MRPSKVLSVASLALLAGCVLPANVVVNLPDDAGQTGSVIVSNASGNTELTRPLAAVGLEAGAPPGQPFITDQQAVKKVFRHVLAATPRQPIAFGVRFLPDTAQIAPASLPELAHAVDALKTMSYPEISVIQHEELVGPVGQDNALPMARAESVAGIFVRAGVPRSAIAIENYGVVAAHSPPSEGPHPIAPIEVTIR